MNAIVEPTLVARVRPIVLRKRDRLCLMALSLACSKKRRQGSLWSRGKSRRRTGGAGRPPDVVLLLLRRARIALASVAGLIAHVARDRLLDQGVAVRREQVALGVGGRERRVQSTRRRRQVQT